jgi:hypothetical protein
LQQLQFLLQQLVESLSAQFLLSSTVEGPLKELLARLEDTVLPLEDFEALCGGFACSR